MLLHKSIEYDSRVRREAKALADAGHDVTVVHLPRTPGELDGELDGFRVVSATPPSWVRERVPFLLYRLVFLIWFVRAVLRQRPEAVHAHDTAMLVPGWLAARRARARLVYDTHEYAPGVPYRERLWAWMVNVVERSLIRRCHAVITVSEGIADRLQERYALRDRPIVVRNVPDPDAYDSSFEAPDLREGLGVAAGAPLVLHLGAVARDRGCDALVRAMADVEEPASLLFLGADDEAYVERLRTTASAASVSERVHFRPSVPIAHVLAYARQANVGVSLLEDSCENHRLALPNKVFEYAAAGVPVVVSDLPELRRLIEGQDIGWLTSGEDPAALGAALRRALASSAKPTFSLSWAHEANALGRVYAEPTAPVDLDGVRALLLVRNPCTHDARVLREARLLLQGGAAVKVLGVVSTSASERSTVVGGLRVDRLAPASPLGRLRALGRRWKAVADVTPAPRSASAAGAGAARRDGAGRRLNRWLVTLDYYRLGIGTVWRSRPDLVHCNDYNTMWIGVAAKLRGSRVVYDSHELWADRNLRPEWRPWIVACEALFVRVADAVVTTSPGYARELARRYRIDEPTVVRNIPERIGRARLPASGDPPLAVYVGAVTSGRGLEVAVRALEHVPELRLRIVGPDAWGYREQLRVLIAELGVEERVELRPPVPPAELASAMDGAHVGLVLIEPVCLSYELTLPNKLFEYGLAGVPVLASDLPVMRELVEGAGLGVIVASGSPPVVGQALSALAAPDEQCRWRSAATAGDAGVNWRDESAALSRAYTGVDAGPGRVRPRLSRTLSRARWSEYERLLSTAVANGYALISLEDWLLEEGLAADRAVILRHDVDQHPGSAVRMAEIEERLGVRSTWYFRWRTAHADVIARLREGGHAVGLHYETLSRAVLRCGLDVPPPDDVIDECRRTLREELATFARLHGPSRTACPHGDSRVPGVNNGVLLRGQDCGEYGIELDGNEGMHGRPLGYWMTDRTRAEGHWVDGVEPGRLLAGGVPTILCLVHPNNWVSGPSLWIDRLLSSVLPPPDGPGWASRPVRTGTDAPPLAGP